MPRGFSLTKLGLGCLIAGLAFVVAALVVGRVPVSKPVVVTHAATPAPAPSPADDEKNDGDALSALRRNGANLSKRTTITHYLYVPQLGDARLAADALEQRGFAVVLERPLGAAPGSAVRTDWGVVASRAETPTIAHLRATRSFFKALATRYRGAYDGWEAEVVR
jgi:hypothetical protein